MTEITLRDYQQPLFDSIIEYMKSAKGHEPAFIDVSVGGGKTAIAAFVAKHVSSKGGRVLLLARQSELVFQGGQFIEKIGLKVSYFSNGLGSKRSNHSVIAATEGTLVRALATTFKALPVDLIILDECHMLNYDDTDTMIMRIILHFQALNKKARILGMTGSPFRDNESILGIFWKVCLAVISTEQLINAAWLVPITFGFPEHEEDSFDLSTMEKAYGSLEFTEEQYDDFRNGHPELTARIMAEVVHRTADDLGVLIFAQSKKHCQEVADALPPGSWAIITDSSTDDERKEAFDNAKSGKIKFTINVGVCSTGWDCPYWQTIVYLRRVGSLVFLIQSMGRMLRLFIESGANLNDMTAEERALEIAASRKPFGRALDYAGVFDRLGPLYENPILAEAEYQQAKKKEGDMLVCPKCATENSRHARRCRNVESNGDRCDYFWISQTCRHCGVENDVTAADCRICDGQLRNPNEKLLNKAYTDEELVPVESMEIQPTKNGGIMFSYILQGEKPEHGWPVEFFSPGGSETARRVWYNQCLKLHIQSSQYRNKIYNIRSSTGVMNLVGAFDKPESIAYRLNPKGKFVVGRKRFKKYGKVIDSDGN